MDTASSNLQLWELILAFVLPLVISLIVQTGWSEKAQALAAFGTSLVSVLGTLFVQGELANWTDPTTSVLTVFALTIAFYKGLWKPIGVPPAIEHATSKAP